MKAVKYINKLVKYMVSIFCHCINCHLYQPGLIRVFKVFSINQRKILRKGNLYFASLIFVAELYR